MRKPFLSANLVSVFATALVLVVSSGICSLAFAQQELMSSTPKYTSLPGEEYFDFGNEPIRYIENDRVKLGFNLAIGGAVVYLEDKLNNSGNMINSCDWGRQIQLSYYSGPAPFIGPNGEEPAKQWAGLGWNPIQAGDCDGYGSRVLQFEIRDDSTVFIKTRPMLWPNRGLLAECLFECLYKLTDNGFELTATIINNRSDKTQYGGRNQETPAVYTNAPWYKLVTYLGDRPFENQPVTVIVDKNDGKGWPWLNYYSPERWNALLNEDNYGLGVYQPNSTGISGGYHGGDPTKGQPLGSTHTATGYIAPREVTILDWNLTRSYKTTFIVGSLEEIRSTVYRLAKRDLSATPSWRFDVDRQNWYYRDTTDEGAPIQDSLKIYLNETTPARAVSPETFWKADDAKVLEIDAECLPLDDNNDVAQFGILITPYSPADDVDYFSWSIEGVVNATADRDAKRKTHPVLPQISASIPVKFDSQRHVYRLKLDELENYKGGMKQLEIVLPQRAGKIRLYQVRFTKD
ncbi:MAG: hypothetical protein Q4G03_07295 [Planctomycetia bacterium]|nr:hypothetical protein [Planctomycetia bacterium]